MLWNPLETLHQKLIAPKINSSMRIALEFLEAKFPECRNKVLLLYRSWKLRALHILTASLLSPVKKYNDHHNVTRLFLDIWEHQISIRVPALIVWAFWVWDNTFAANIELPTRFFILLLVNIVHSVSNRDLSRYSPLMMTNTQQHHIYPRSIVITQQVIPSL